MTAIALVACRAAGAEPASAPRSGEPASPASPQRPEPTSPTIVPTPVEPAGATAAGATAAGATAAGTATRLASATARPASWRALPALATASASAAGAAGVTVDTADAWGDPAMGCYAVWLALRGPAADPAALTDQVLAGLAGLVPSAVVRPSGPGGTLGFSFTRPPYRGQARVRLASGQVSAVACFANEREPAACTAACAGVLEHVP